MQKNFQIQCAEMFAELVQIFGVPKSVGQIYGVLYATPEPLSFSDIVEQLNISKGSASQGLQLLRSLGAVRHVEQLERSFSRRLFCQSLQRLVPAIQESDLTTGGAGVRAQAMDPAGPGCWCRISHLLSDLMPCI